MQGLKCSGNGMQNSDEHANVAVVLVPFPAQGHLNQLLHLSHIITSYGIPVYFAGSATHNRQAKVRLHGWDSKSSTKIHFHDLQLPAFTSPPINPDPSMHFPVHLTPLFEASTHLRQPVTKLVQQLSKTFMRIIVIHDSIVTSVAQDVKLIPNAETYTFMPISAFAVFLGFWGSIPDAEKPFQLDFELPNHMPYREGCLPPEVDEFLTHQWSLMGSESGRLYNTSRWVEGRYLQLLEKLIDNSDIKHFAIGPINPVQVKNSCSSEKQKHRCLQWLDKQDKASVIYVSFGSTTSMTDEQITELALGLEKSEQKFIWVLRRADKSDVFGKCEESLLQLPEGFEERLYDRGIIVREWAPQLEILAHPSTGGFMSHCGWNSCIESMSMGVPIAAWPMHSEQPRNTILVTEMLKVGTVVRNWAHRSELVTSSTIQKAVITLMASKEGDKIRERAAKLGEAIQGSVAEDGPSRIEMDSFIAHISRSQASDV